MVYSVLEAQILAEDRLLHRLAFQVAGIMLTSGNMKKSSKPEDVVRSIYAPLIPTEDKPVEKTVERKELNQDQANQFIADLENRINNSGGNSRQ